MHQPWLDVTHQGICITSQEQSSLENSTWFERGFENDKGHLISEQICEDIDFPKSQQKYC